MLPFVSSFYITEIPGKGLIFSIKHKNTTINEMKKIN